MFKHVHVSFKKLLSADVHIHFLLLGFFFFEWATSCFSSLAMTGIDTLHIHPYSDTQTFLCGRYQEEATMLAYGNVCFKV